MILTPLQKLHNNVGNLGTIIVVTGFEWLPIVQKIANLVTLPAIIIDSKRLKYLMKYLSLVVTVFALQYACHGFEYSSGYINSERNKRKP